MMSSDDCHVKLKTERPVPNEAVQSTYVPRNWLYTESVYTLNMFQYIVTSVATTSQNFLEKNY